MSASLLLKTKGKVKKQITNPKTQYKPLINRFGKKKNLFLAARTVVGGKHNGGR
jgi:hypothetical protein